MKQEACDGIPAYVCVCLGIISSAARHTLAAKIT